MKAQIEQLEKENKKLKEENAKLKDIIITDENFEEKQDNEIKKLKEEKEKSDSIINKKIIDLHNQVVELLEENKKLKEYNSNLMKEVKLCYKKNQN
jgi:regulator of replication initiation timing